MKSHDLLSYIDDLCSHQEENSDLKVKKLKTDLEDAQKAFKKSEKMLNDLHKEHEEQRQKWEKEMKLKQDTDIHKKEQEIKDVTIEYHSIGYTFNDPLHCSSTRNLRLRKNNSIY